MTTLLAVTQMDPRQEEIFSFCEKYFFDHENPVLVNKNARFFTEGYDAFGLDEIQLKELRNEVLARFQPSVPELGKLAWHFFATGKYEFGSLAILLLKKHRPRFDRSIYDEIRRCLDGVVENWAHADLIATKITPIFLELNLATMDDFRSWLSSESKWTRRVAAVTMLWQRNRLPVSELLDFAQPLMLDEARPVQQGVGWLLRELWKLFPREVEDFLFQNKDRSPRLIIQYATEKMNKDKKKRFRRAISEDKKSRKPQFRKEKKTPEDTHE
ncbi:MAG: DNA alkylation repair protein [Candidatus Syntrophosphaera sp.]|nr:DNA alkylation repair protein [Candidatus Syntrophosphaera sp.]